MKGRKLNISPMLMMLILLIVTRFIRNGMTDPMEWISDRLVMLPAILVGLSLHEFGHAIVSDKLGDPTPRLQGRVTISPLAHVDPMGLLCLIFAGFGWGRPVQIDPTYYKHRRRDEAMTAVAGVTMNLIIAIISTLIIKMIVQMAPTFLDSTVGEVIIEILQYMIYINIVLMFFNLIPVPPLDGFNIITQIFDLRKYSWYYTFSSYGGIILLLIVLFGGTSYILGPLVRSLYNICISFITA